MVLESTESEGGLVADCFVGRQPILDRNNQIYAYELLHRSGLDNEVGSVNRTVATARVIISSFVDIGLENLVGSNPAILNVTEGFIQDPELVCFSPGQIVLALPGDLEPTAENWSAIERLKGDGFTLAINGYRAELLSAQFLPAVDIVMLDALETDNETLAGQLRSLDARVLKIAKRVETTHRRDELIELGFNCFQGHYFTKPEIVTGKGSPTNRAAVLQLVAKVSNPETSTEEIEELVAMDPALSLRILRFVNSPLSGLAVEIESIRHAVVLVGRDTIKNWVMLLALSSLSNGVHELIVTAFIRAKFCEQLATEAKIPGVDSFFTVGLFSVMDTMMATPMEELLEPLPFTDQIKWALIDGVGPQGDAVQCVQKLETGQVDGCRFQVVPMERLADIYLESLMWSDNVNALVG